MNLYQSYPEYLQSNHWRRLRSKIHERAQYKCEICAKNNKNSKLAEVHHINYHNWIDVVESDLVGVCELCHSKIHAAIKAGFIDLDNRGSLKKTSKGLDNFAINKGMLKTGQIQKYEVTEFTLEQISKVPFHHRKLLYGLFKVYPTNDWRFLLGRVLSKRIFNELVEILKLSGLNCSKEFEDDCEQMRLKNKKLRPLAKDQKEAVNNSFNEKCKKSLDIFKETLNNLHIQT